MRADSRPFDNRYLLGKFWPSAHSRGLRPFQRARWRGASIVDHAFGPFCSPGKDGTHTGQSARYGDALTAIQGCVECAHRKLKAEYGIYESHVETGHTKHVRTLCTEVCIFCAA